MFYEMFERKTHPFSRGSSHSECKVCGKVRRWLDREEVKDPNIVAANKHRPLTQEEYDAVDKKTVLDIHCLEHAPKEKKKTKKKVACED